MAYHSPSAPSTRSLCRAPTYRPKGSIRKLRAKAAPSNVKLADSRSAKSVRAPRVSASAHLAASEGDANVAGNAEVRASNNCCVDVAFSTLEATVPSIGAEKENCKICVKHS